MDLSMTEITVNLVGSTEEVSSLLEGGDHLLERCAKEVDEFDRYLRSYGNEYRTGLVPLEKRALVGFLYQSLRGNLKKWRDRGLSERQGAGSP